MSDILTALNTSGSGLDIAALSKSLATAEVAPRQDIIQNRMDGIEVSISALAEARSLMEEVQAALEVTVDESLMQTSSNDSNITATVTDKTKVTAGTDSLGVTALAKEQVLEFSGFTSKDAVVQSGSITIEFGVWTAEDPPVFYDAGERPSFDMTVADGTTLSQLAEQFDNVDGIEATIIDVGDGTFTIGILSETGAKNGMRFTANATGAAADVALTDFDLTTTINDHQLRGASDAVLEFNGITVYRSSNEIDDLIDGVLLEITGPTASPATLTTEIEYAEAKARMDILVAKVNEALEYLDEQTSRGVFEGTEAGDLVGETAIEAMKFGIRSVLRSEITGFGDETYYLSDFGVSMNRSGTLEFDEDVFEEVMDNTPEALMALFESTTSASDPSVTVAGAPPTGTVTSTFTFTRDTLNGTAFLDGTELTSLFATDENDFFIVASGEMSGISLTVPVGVDTFEVTYGRSLMDSLIDRLDDALSSGGTLNSRESELSESLAENEEELSELDDKYTGLESRYLEKFTAMEIMITQLNDTGNYIDSLLNAWEAAANG